MAGTLSSICVGTIYKPIFDNKKRGKTSTVAHAYVRELRTRQEDHEVETAWLTQQDTVSNNRRRGRKERKRRTREKERMRLKRRQQTRKVTKRKKEERKILNVTKVALLDF